MQIRHGKSGFKQASEKEAEAFDREFLYLGKYFVKEITPPTGYLTDKNEYASNVVLLYIVQSGQTTRASIS